MRNYVVYILRCADGSYYTGVTNDIERRVAEHQQGIIPGYTHTRRPLQLVFSEAFSDVTQAIVFEKQLKGWSRKKKEALIRADFAMLKKLSRRKGAQ